MASPLKPLVQVEEPQKFVLQCSQRKTQKEEESPKTLITLDISSITYKK
jgi:hypothetical protein